MQLDPDVVLHEAHRAESGSKGLRRAVKSPEPVEEIAPRMRPARLGGKETKGTGAPVVITHRERVGARQYLEPPPRRFPDQPRSPERLQPAAVVADRERGRITVREQALDDPATRARPLAESPRQTGERAALADPRHRADHVPALRILLQGAERRDLEPFLTSNLP